MSAQIWLGNDWFASHRSAGCIWGFDAIPEGWLEFSGPFSRRTARGIVLHRSSRVNGGEVVTRKGFRITSASRTLVDLGSVVGPDDVEAAVESALRKGLVSTDYLTKVLDRHRVRGRSGAGTLAKVLGQRPMSAPTESLFETRLHQALRRSGIPSPTRQFWIMNEGERLGRVDFAYPLRRVVLEADSYENHSSRLDWESDIARYNQLTSLGWSVLRITWRQLRDHPGEVVEQIGRTLGIARLPLR